MSHLGRPDGFNSKYSLAPVQTYLSKLLGQKVNLLSISEYSNSENIFENGNVVLLENLRFHKEEPQNSADFAKLLAKKCDIYINEAFSCSHRKHTSVYAVAKILPSYFGFDIENEVEYIESVIRDTNKDSSVCIIGGSKISTKITLLRQICTKVKAIAIGGGMANTFLAAQGHNVGLSLTQQDFYSESLKIMKFATENNCEIILPVDVIVAKSLERPSYVRCCGVDEVKPSEMILDIGPRTVTEIASKIHKGNKVLWNGPVGAFEYRPFDVGNAHLARLVSSMDCVSIVGGGDTAAAVNSACLLDQFSHVSTGGGAFLEYLENGSLPGVEVIRNQS